MEGADSVTIPRFESAERLFFNPHAHPQRPNVPREGLTTHLAREALKTRPSGDNSLKVKDNEELEIQKKKWLRQVISGELHSKGYGVPGRGRRILKSNPTNEQDIEETGEEPLETFPALDKQKSKSFIDMPRDRRRSSEVNFSGQQRRDSQQQHSKLYASNPMLNLGKQDRRRSSMYMSTGTRRDSTYMSLPSQINLRSLHLTEEEMDKIRTRDHRKERGIQAKIIIADDIFGKEDGYKQDTERAEGEKEEGKVQDEDIKRAAEMVENDWLLDEQLKEEMRKFQRLSNKLSIKKPDEDTMAAIDRRMKEVKIMTRQQRDTRPVIDRLNPELRERILRIDKIHVDDIKREKRKKWKLRDMLIWSVQMIRFLLRCFRSRKKYYVDANDMAQLRRRIEKEMQDSQSPTPTNKSSLPADIRIALTTMPELRDKKSKEQVLWLLRTNRAFKSLFPAEMEDELAKYVAYEKYDDGRILAYQGRTPDRFYYILAGRANILRQYKLSTGFVTKSMCYLTKGMMTDPEEMEKQWFREDSIIAKGQVEVLIIDKDAFKKLLTSHQGPPVDFLKSIPLFDGFSPENFLQHTDAIEYKYYGQGKMLLKDSNRTNWLHVVKSGTVKVVRRQMVIDSVPSNAKKFSSKRQDELGCTKSSSHATAMMGVQAKQKKFAQMKKKNTSLPQKRATSELDGVLQKIKKKNKPDPDNRVYNDTRLPCLHDIQSNGPRMSRELSSRSMTSEESQRPFSGVLSQPYIRDTRSAYTKSPYPQTIGVTEVDMNESMEQMAQDFEHQMCSPVIYRGSASTKNSTNSALSRKSAHLVDDHAYEPSDDDISGEVEAVETAVQQLESPNKQKRCDVVTKLPAINIPVRSAPSLVSSYEPHNTWLTRERTENDIEQEIYKKLFPKRKSETSYRRAYLQLDVLNSGDVFGCNELLECVKHRKGLDHLHQTLASEPHGFSLLSEGAEIVKVSKRFFLQYASNNTMMKVELMYKEYQSEEEAKDSLYLTETWQQYKDALWHRITDPLTPPAPYTVR